MGKDLAHVLCHAVYLAVLFLGSDDPPKPVPLEPTPIDVLFSPRGGITQRIVAEISCADKSVYVQACSFTSRPIAEALIKAKDRGVRIEVCADDSNKNPDTSVCDELTAGLIPVYLDAKHAIAHSKVLIIDEHLVISGSFNLTMAAERSNLENCLFIQSKNLAKQYRENFAEHRKHSTILRRDDDLNE